MSRKNSVKKIKLVSSKNTGHFYTSRKGKKGKLKKIIIKKYDPYLRKHVIYKETKLK